MKQFLQDNGPSQIWIQTWSESQEGSGIALEPQVWGQEDEWRGQLFNYYFLSGFSKETGGQLNMELADDEDINALLNSYFSTGSLGELHSCFSEKWAEKLPACDEDACWFTVAWENFILDEYEGKALGFFFSNERKSFLANTETEAIVLKGLPLSKPEYAALFIPENDSSWKLFVSEPGGQTALRTPWTLSLFPFQPCYQDSFHAKQFFQMCKSFSEDVLVKEKKNNREEQVAFLSESADYAAKKNEINFENFKADVLKEPGLVDAFEGYQEKYTASKGWNPPDQFAMTDVDQKQIRKFVKSVIKLDKNFHIYVHGNKERIERGFDEQKKLHYYTLWFDSEA